MASKRLEELQKKLQDAEDGREPLSDEELEELEGGKDRICDKDGSCKIVNNCCPTTPPVANP